MSSSNYLKNIAIVGGSGTLGTPTLEQLLNINQANITAISRRDSTAEFPPSVRVLKGDYTSHNFLVSALKGQDALVLIFSLDSMDRQFAFITAAAEAGVKYILPTEFGSDTEHKGLTSAVPVLQFKVQVRQAIEKAGLTWIGLVNNPWLDFSLRSGLYGIEVVGRKATIYDDGAPFETTVLKTSGLALARLLGLPIDGSPGLNDYANRLVFVSSGLVTQAQIFEFVKQATKTQDSDWTITHAEAGNRIKEGQELLAKGDMAGIPALMYGYLMVEDMGGDYSKTKGLDNKALELPEEDLLEAVKTALA